MSSEEFDGLGFAPGVVRGIRSFDVDKFGRLTGIHYRQVWTPGENNAECKRDASMDDYMNMIRNLAATVSYPAPRRTLFGGSYTPSISHGVVKGPGEPKPLQHKFTDCRCGFYGYFDGSDDYHDNGRITAVVEAYGEAVIGTRGFRAMKASIVALRVKGGADGISEPMARKLRNNYAGIPVFETFDAMLAEFPPDESLEPSPSSDPDFWTRTA